MAKQFKIPFKSLAGKDCLINIYNSQYSGSAVSLSTDNVNAPAYPAANPIYIEEDSEESLLHVLRAKTGYITLIERTFGALQSLYPETNTQNIVELFYDGQLVFYGYMQAQAFDNEWVGAPRTLQFPIVSPLGVMSEQNMSDNSSDADSMLGEYLDSVLSVYDYVIMPLSIFTSDDGAVQPLQLRVNSRTVCPWNPDYDFGLLSMGETPSLYAPITEAVFLEGFCSLYGLIAHEVGKTIIFSRFGYSGQYIKMAVGDLQEDSYDTTGLPDGDDVLAFESVFDIASTDNHEGNIMPLSKLTLDYGEHIDGATMDLSRSKAVMRVSLPAYEEQGLSNLMILNKQTAEFSSPYYTTNGGTLSTQNHVRIVGDGSNEMVELRVVSDVQVAEIFSYTFTNVPVNIAGGTIASTFEEGQKLKMVVRSGGKYYDANHDWVSSPYYHELNFDENGNVSTYDIASNGRTVTVTLYTTGPESAGGTAEGIIKSFDLDTFTDGLRVYEVSTDTQRTFVGNNGSNETATIDMLFHSAVGNDRRVSGGNAITPTYPYMLLAQLRHDRTVKVKAAASVNFEHIYLYMVETSGYTGKWRVISVGFDPRNDNYRIVMHRSSTLST